MKDNQDAINEYFNALRKAAKLNREIMTQLVNLSAKNINTINWGHVGDVQHIISVLQDIKFTDDVLQYYNEE